MKMNRRRLSGVLLASFAIAALTSSQALANPDPFFEPGLCGAGSAYNWMNVKDRSVSIFNSGQVLETTIHNRADCKAGYNVQIDGLTPLSGGGGAWLNLTLHFKVGNSNSGADRDNDISPNNLVIYLHLQNGVSASKTFSELGVTTLNRGNWQSLTIRPEDIRRVKNFVKGQVLDRVVVYQMTRNDVFSHITFGNIQINYAGQGIPEPGQISLTSGRCTALEPNP